MPSAQQLVHNPKVSIPADSHHRTDLTLRMGGTGFLTNNYFISRTGMTSRGTIKKPSIKNLVDNVN
jgi:hypothetical protein